MNEADRMRKIFFDNQALLHMSDEDANMQKFAASVLRIRALKEKSDDIYNYDFKPRIESSAVSSRNVTFVICIIGNGTPVLNLTQTQDMYLNVNEDAIAICNICKNILIRRGFKAKVWFDLTEADEFNNRDKIFKLQVEW